MQTTQKVNLFRTGIVKQAREGLGNYIPSLPGLRLEEEGGVTVTSTENLEKIVKKCGPPDSAEIVPEGILFFFTPSTRKAIPVFAYLATGFIVGYRGEGPTGFARFLSKHWGLEFEDTVNFISNCVQKHGGTITPKKGLQFTRHSDGE